MDTHEWACRIKSARQKRRLVKTDRDKQLIQLHKRRNDLWDQRKLLPMVPLQHPYQRGWKRFFVLRDDVKHSPRMAFYEALLPKINTVEYHHDKSFKRKKRRKKRYGYHIKQQLLQEFHPYYWYANKMGLTEEEKACFTRVETYNIKTRQAEAKYVIAEPWRYVLKIAPHMVTHIKLIDVDIERELSYIKTNIDNHNLAPRIETLTRGRGYSSYDWFSERAKYINNFKNIPRYAHKEVYLDLET